LASFLQAFVATKLQANTVPEPTAPARQGGRDSGGTVINNYYDITVPATVDKPINREELVIDLLQRIKRRTGG
jgi:hypothetical protein